MIGSAKRLMFLGTGSDVGKSLLTAAFCRILKQDGYRVAPFKAQNMALNSFITAEGAEMGRAQVVQAEAAGIAPHVDMNPVLLKPTSQMGSQVIVLGKPVGNFSARDYYRYKTELLPVVREAFGRLAQRYDVVVLEGAGSAVELNLKENDLVNLSMAHWAEAPCVLVGDIDRGGIFASLLGSLALMSSEERRRIVGMMVNKLRGDPALFSGGVRILEDRSGCPVLGVIPHFDHISIAEEDSVALGKRMRRGADVAPSAGKVAVGVLRLPFISNYTDFDCFEREPGVDLVYFDEPASVFRFDAVVLPGSKNTLEDLDHLRRTGMADAVKAYYKSGGTVVGICGGYQMLGRRLLDPQGVESALRELPGLGLLAMETEMFPEKTTTQSEAVPLEELAGLGEQIGEGSAGESLHGYEIHMGRSRPLEGRERPLFRVFKRNGEPADDRDGLIGEDGRVWGTYLHGVFDNDGFRRRFLEFLRHRSGKTEAAPGEAFTYAKWKDEQYDLLADHVRAHCDVDLVYRLAGLE